MNLTYGKRFIDQWIGVKPDAMIEHWAHELAGYSREELQNGYLAMQSRDWPPTLPEFKKLCRPPLDALAAYYEALRGLEARRKGQMGHWSHPAIYWAACPMTFDLLHQTWASLSGRWDKALHEQLAQGTWQPIPPVAPALPYQPGNANRGTANTHASRVLAQLNAHGVSLHANSRIDHKRWAKRLLQRAEQGDVNVTPIMLRMAKAALGMIHEM
jgi:hypothetical protein